MVVGFVGIHISFKKFILLSMSDFKDSFIYLTSSPSDSTRGSSTITGTLWILTTLNGSEFLKRKEVTGKGVAIAYLVASTSSH